MIHYAEICSYKVDMKFSTEFLKFVTSFTKNFINLCFSSKCLYSKTVARHCHRAVLILQLAAKSLYLGLYSTAICHYPRAAKPIKATQDETRCTFEEKA